MAFAREAAGMGQLGQGRLRAIVDRGPKGLESPRPDPARDSAPVLQEPVETGSIQDVRGRDTPGRQTPTAEERRVGQECGCKCRYGWSATHYKKNKTQKTP